jgi:hypothetical protein
LDFVAKFVNSFPVRFKPYFRVFDVFESGYAGCGYGLDVIRYNCSLSLSAFRDYHREEIKANHRPPLVSAFSFSSIAFIRQLEITSNASVLSNASASVAVTIASTTERKLYNFAWIAFFANMCFPLKIEVVVLPT